MGVNKSEKCIFFMIVLVDVIDEVCIKFDRSVNLKLKSGRYFLLFFEVDSKIVYKKLRDLRLFYYYLGRICKGFNNISFILFFWEEMFKFKERFK